LTNLLDAKAGKSSLLLIVFDVTNVSFQGFSFSSFPTLLENVWMESVTALLRFFIRKKKETAL